LEAGLLTDFSKTPQDLFSGSFVVTCGQTDMMKLIGSFLKLLVVNTPKCWWKA
jgi:hypothetical protein